MSPHAFGGALALAWCTERARGTIDIDLNVFVDGSRAREVLAALPGGVRVDGRRSRAHRARRSGAAVVGHDTRRRLPEHHRVPRAGRRPVPMGALRGRRRPVPVVLGSRGVQGVLQPDARTGPISRRWPRWARSTSTASSACSRATSGPTTNASRACCACLDPVPDRARRGRAQDVGGGQPGTSARSLHARCALTS